MIKIVIHFDCEGNILITRIEWFYKWKMPILFSAVARDKVVLARFASCEGNFTEIASEVLSKVASHNEKITYFHGPYLFHYIAETDHLYFCITDKVSFMYLTLKLTLPQTITLFTCDQRWGRVYLYECIPSRSIYCYETS